MTGKEKEALRLRASLIMERLAEAIPEPRSELNYNSPFQLLAAVLLSAQTTDRRVNEVTPALFAAAPDPESMAALGPEGIYQHIRSLGLAGGKSRNLAAAALQICQRFGGRVPDTFEDLTSLPGVGGKTARVVLNVGFGRPEIAVDTHILRVSRRLGLTVSSLPDQVSRDLAGLIPEQHLLNAHHYLLLHGRHTCRARSPLCQHCCMQDLCTSPDRKFTEA